MPSLAATLAPEDFQPGAMVAILNEIGEYPSFFWCADASTLPPDEPVRIRWRAGDGGRPLKVVAVCLPFVCLEDPCGGVRTIDVRTTECVRLHRDYARFVWKKLRRSHQRLLRRLR